MSLLRGWNNCKNTEKNVNVIKNFYFIEDIK